MTSSLNLLNVLSRWIYSVSPLDQTYGGGQTQKTSPSGLMPDYGQSGDLLSVALVKRIWLISTPSKSDQSLSSEYRFGTLPWKGPVDFYLHCIRQQEYYPDARLQLQLETLEERRVNLCRNFAVRAAKHNKYHNWFKLASNTGPSQGSPLTLYQTPVIRLTRFRDSYIPYLTSLPNETPCEDWQNPT